MHNIVCKRLPFSRWFFRYQHGVQRRRLDTISSWTRKRSRLSTYDNDKWTVKLTLIKYFILAVCTPQCQNGGHCLSYNVCQCPPTHRGPHCQYDVESCSPKKMQFNGAYNCSGDNNRIRCILSCPHGVDFDFKPAAQYTCTYESGYFEPASIPKCQFSMSLIVF